MFYCSVVVLLTVAFICVYPWYLRIKKMTADKRLEGKELEFFFQHESFPLSFMNKAELLNKQHGH